MENKPLGMELPNSSDAHGETASEQEIPLASSDDFPSISREFEREKKMVIRHGKFNTKTQEQKNGSTETARRQRETSSHEVKQEMTDVAEVVPLDECMSNDSFHEREKCLGQWSN